MADSFQTRTLARKNKKGLALSAPAPKAPNPADNDIQIPGALANVDSNRVDTLEIGLEFKLDLRSEDLIVLKELGAGNGGTVCKVMHATTKVIMARKIIRVDAKENVRKQIVRELQVGHDCSSPNVITFYGAFQNEARDIVLCMEYMDCGSLDRISKDFGPVRVDVLGKITESVLGGLVYLYEAHRIMHRDIKPSNVLVNSRGMIKLCDFGVATETVNSVADTFVGTSTYMAPERIQGSPYTIKSDVWSVGLTVMELAIGRFPFDSSESAAGDRVSAGPMGILDLLQAIVHEPAPKLPKSEAFPPILEDFVAKCLLKSNDERPTPRQLYDNDPFVQAAKRTPVDLQEWAVAMMDRHNRKSYLAPPAPTSLNRDGSNSVTTTTATQSMFPVEAPTFQSIPSVSPVPRPDTAPPQRYITTFPTDSMNGNYRGPQTAVPSTQIPTGIVERTPPPPLSLEHLSLETQENDGYVNGHISKSNRLGFSNRDNIPEPASAIEQTRPSFPPRTSSNSSGFASRMGGLSNSTLPIRAPPPTGPLPPPPISKDNITPIRGTMSAGFISPRRGR